MFCAVVGLWNTNACSKTEPNKAQTRKDQLAAAIYGTSLKEEPPQETAEYSDALSTRQATIIQNITNPVIERVVNTREIVRESGLTQSQLDIALNELRKELYNTQASSDNQQSTAIWRAISLTNKIDNLSSITLGNSTITGSPISGSSGSFTALTASGATTLDALTVSGASSFSALSLTTALPIASGGTGATTTTTARNNLGLAYATTADVTALGYSIAMWGDSLTAPASQLADMSGYTVYNGGVGGETSTQIKTRMLAATNKHSWPTIIWAGRNNYTSPTTVKADIASMVAALGNSNYLVLSILNGEYANEYSGQSGYVTMMQLNSDLETTYGSRYVDVRSYLVSNYNSGAPQDVIDYGHDIVPDSLRIDNIHLTTEGYRLVAEKMYLVIDTLVGSNDVKNSILTVEDVRQMLGDFSTGYSIDNDRVLYANSANYSTLVGIMSGQSLLSDGQYSTSIGYEALKSATSSVSNTAVGYQSLYLNTSGVENTAQGKQSMRGNTSGSYNSAVGKDALFANSEGSLNASLGYRSLYSNTTGANNVAVGGRAMFQLTSGYNNIGMGLDALYYNSTGANNTALGFRAGYGASGASNITGNTLIGYQSGYALLTNGNNNTLLGYAAGDNITTGARNIIIGFGTDAASSTDSDQLNIGNTIYGDLSTGNVGIGTTSPASLLDVWGDFRVGTSSTPALFVDVSSGNVSIGTTSTAGGRLTVTGGNMLLQEDNAIFYLKMTDGTGNGGLQVSGNGNYVQTVGSGLVPSLDNTQVLGLESKRWSRIFVGTGDSSFAGNVGIGTTTLSAQLHTTGTVRFANFGAGTLTTDASGNLSVSSDERLKDLQGNFTTSLDALQNIEPIKYRWSEDSGFDTSTLYAGFSAQNIKESIPEAVGEDKRGFLTLSDRPILATVVNAVKDMWNSITELRNESRGKDSQLEARIAALEALLAASGASGNTSGNSAESDDDSSTPFVPTITILGSNPTEIELGANYSDLGANAKNPDGNDISITTLVDGEEVQQVQLDTSTSTTYIIEYRARWEGEVATTTRKVLVGTATSTESEADSTDDETAATTTSTTDAIVDTTPESTEPATTTPTSTETTTTTEE